MSTGAARPTKCKKCGATPKCPGTNCRPCKLRQEGKCLVGYWDWRSERIENNIYWYVVCSDCWRGEILDKQREAVGTTEE